MKDEPLVWRLIVWGVAPQHASLMTRLNMIRSRKNPNRFWREYPPTKRDQVVSAIEQLAAAGLHGKARRSAKPPPPPATDRPSSSGGGAGFGGTLNARPIAGAWRRKAKRK